MQRNELISILRKWSASMKAMDKQVDFAMDTLGLALESDLVQSMMQMQSDYTEQLSESIGDKANWLAWYWLECNLGSAPKKVYSYTRDITCDSIRKLATIINAEGNS
jgi:hypothetical protein